MSTQPSPFLLAVTATGLLTLASAGAQRPVPGLPVTPAPVAAPPTGAPTAAPTGAPTAAAAAQEPKPAEPGATPPAPAQDPAAAAAAAAKAQAAQKKAEEEQKKQQRLQKIQQVKFDRLAPTILRTWSTPPGAEDASAAPGGAPVSAGPAPAADKKVVAAIDNVTLGPIGRTPPRLEFMGPPVMLQPPADAAAGQPAKPAPDPFDLALKDWIRNVTIGDWPQVKAFLTGLATEDEKKAAWNAMLNGLRAAPQQQPNRPQQQQGPFQPTNYFTFADVVGIAAAAPVPFDDQAFQGLGALLQLALQRGNLIEPFVALLRAEIGKPAGERALNRRDAVKLLLAANLPVEAGEFLPSLETATAGTDFEALNLLARHFLGKNQKDAKATLFLEQAWTALQAVFAAPNVDRKLKEEALKLAVGLAPRLKKELGKTWLDQSFTKDLQRGMDIIASIGVAAAETLQTQPNSPEFRQQALQLQSTAVGALLAAAPERAGHWRVQLGILADNWLREAQITWQYDRSESYAPTMRRDPYGNFFYYDDEMWRRQAMPVQPIKTPDLLELRPGAEWLQLVEDGIRPKFAMVTAQLWLKVQEEEQAFPYIAELSNTHPQQAKELVDEFLRIWTRNHDPNAARRNYYFYGYEQRAEGIPLTRSKQQRNLAELSALIGRLRALPIGDPNEELLAKAFTTCHSSAEVYQLAAIEAVFGSLENLKPKTLAALAQQMRGNLMTVWRRPATQEQAKTRRKQKDIEAEVLRGYEVARAVLDGALAEHDGDPSLLLARATLRHDENDFRRELVDDAQFTARRQEAFADFQAAADAYARAVPELSRGDETTIVYEQWFYAALGASDLPNISHEHVPVTSQIDLVKQHVAALPGDAAERHLAMFANKLFTNMGGLNPAVKFRYVKHGLDIVGNHKQAFEARKVYDYYKDIVSEIQLVARVDGSTTVGQQPFGLFVDIRHTREIERESGGFGRYLRNQNDVSYSYNYGRPTENYRDKFSEMCNQSLGEQFEVLSVTFQSDKVHSRATEEYGWRITPYAYVLLKPRGAQIDRIPQLRLDLDFLDTSGYAVLPVESPLVAIDAAGQASARPVRGLEVTQILDERRARDGKLVLEIKATARGLVPPLDELLDLSPADFEIVSTDDSGAMVARFDPDDESAIVTERTWNVALQAKEGLAEQPRKFRFASARLPEIKLVCQRYADADLVAATPEVDLLERYGAPSRTWIIWVALGALAFALGLAGFVQLRRRRPAAAEGLQLPSQLTPFTVLGLLREIQQTGHLDDGSRQELENAIAGIEAGWFAQDGASNGNGGEELRFLATTWVQRASRRQAVG